MTGKPAGARANREGKPWKRADGRWVMRLYPPEGSVQARPRYIYGKTRAECKRKHDEARARRDAGLLPEPGETEVRVGPALRRWLYETLPQKVRAGEMKHATMVNYQDTAENHIIPEPPKPGPTLAHIGVAALRAPAIRDWRDGLLRKPSGRQRKTLRDGETVLPAPVLLGPRTAELARAVLHAFIEDLIRDESVPGLTRNYVDLVEPPGGRRSGAAGLKPRLTAREAAVLLEQMAVDRLWCYWLVAFAQGYRRGEGLGMRWADVDLDGLTWTPSMQVQRVRGERDPVTGRRRGKLMLVPLKTAAAGQPVALTRVAAEGLAAWKREQAQRELAARVWADLGLVFTTSVGTALEPRNVNRAWDALCVRAGVPGTTIHDLRRACASFVLSSGTDIKTVQQYLRHSRASTTEVYLYAVAEVPRQAADAMDEVIAGLRAMRP